MARVKVGDVIEVTTVKGVVYAQYTYKHRRYGALIRVYRHFFEARPKDFGNLLEADPTFTCFSLWVLQ
jgi:hypothetical protein